MDSVLMLAFLSLFFVVFLEIFFGEFTLFMLQSQKFLVL